MTTQHDSAATAVLTPVGDAHQGVAAGARERVARLDGPAKLAWAGAAVTAFAFLLLPYAARGSAAELGGRLWWRPILAIAAAALVTAASRRADSTAVVAVAVAAAALTESGLFALVSNATPDRRIGFFVMLIGTALVLVAAFRAATRNTY